MPRTTIYYDPDMSAEEFKERYAGMYQKDMGKRLSVSSLVGIWERFLRYERHDFLKAHVNLSLEEIERIGIDKFIYTMGWFKKSQVIRWRQNKLRIGVCAHCKDQFLPMILQHNFGLCRHCRPLYSATAMRQFVVKQMYSERYEHAHRDLFMDFYILFYKDDALRELFLKTSDYAQELEQDTTETPEWYEEEATQSIALPKGAKIIDGESESVDGGSDTDRVQPFQSAGIGERTEASGT